MKDESFVYRLTRKFNPFKMKKGLINYVKKKVENNQTIVNIDVVRNKARVAGEFSTFLKWIYDSADQLIECIQLLQDLDEIRNEILQEINQETVIDNQEINEDGDEEGLLSEEEKENILKNVIESKLEEFETLKETLNQLDSQSISELKSFAVPPNLAVGATQVGILIRYGKLKKTWKGMLKDLVKLQKEKLGDIDLKKQSRKKFMKIKQIVEDNENLIDEGRVGAVSRACQSFFILTKFFHEIALKITEEEDNLKGKKKINNPEDQMEEIEDQNEEKDKKILEEIYERRKEEFDQLKGHIDQNTMAIMKGFLKTNPSLINPILFDAHRIYYYITTGKIVCSHKGYKSTNINLSPKDPTELTRHQYERVNELVKLNPEILRERRFIKGISSPTLILCFYVEIMNEIGQELLNSGNDENEPSDIKALIAADYAVRCILGSEESEPKSLEGVIVTKQELSKIVTGKFISNLKKSLLTSAGENLGEIESGLKKFELKFNESDFPEAKRFFSKLLHLAKTFDVLSTETVNSCLSSIMSNSEEKITIQDFKLGILNTFINQTLSKKKLNVLVFYNAVIQNELESTQGVPETIEEAVNRVKAHLKLEGKTSAQTTLFNGLSNKRTPVKFTVLEHYQLLDETEFEGMSDIKSRLVYLTILTDALLKNLNLTTDNGKWKLILDFVNRADLDESKKETLINDMSHLITTYYTNEQIDEGNQEKIRTLVGKLFEKTSFDEETVQVEGFNLPQTGSNHMNAVESLPEDAEFGELIASTSGNDIFSKDNKYFQIPGNDVIEILRFLGRGISLLDSNKSHWSEIQKEMEEFKIRMGGLDEKASGEGQGNKLASLNLDLWESFYNNFQKGFGGNLSNSEIEKRKLRKQFGECPFFSLKNFHNEMIKMIEELESFDVEAEVEVSNVIHLRA